jgi:hypothetical protein
MKQSTGMIWLVVMIAAAIAAAAARPQAHDGPPFPVVQDRTAGPYRISIWTDPDATDDGSQGGQFWVLIEPADQAVLLPADTLASVSITPLDRSGPGRKGRTAPVSGDVRRQFVALLIDHEGRHAVRAAIEGPLGAAAVDAQVEATYDLRPAPIMLAVYVMPFVLAGFLWAKLLLRRRSLPRA